MTLWTLRHLYTLHVFKEWKIYRFTEAEDLAFDNEHQIVLNIGTSKEDGTRFARDVINNTMDETSRHNEENI